MTAIRISSVEGNPQNLDGGSMFGNAPRPMWEKWAKPDDLGRIPLACRAMLVETADRKILCETGIGVFFEPKLRERFGIGGGDEHLLLKNLDRLGLQPEEITDVILSHLHFDHAGGLLSAWSADSPLEIVFPKAKIFVGEEAWDRAQNPHFRDRASFIPELNQLLKDSNFLRVVGSNQDSHPELPTAFRFTYSYGHTPGQMHTVVSGKDSKILFAGDMIPGRPWVHVPITMGYDRYPEKLIDEKSTILNNLAQSDDNLVFFTHDPETAASSIEFNGKKFKTKKDLPILNRFELA